MESLESNSSDTAKSIAIMTEKNNVNTELLTYNSKKIECESNMKMLESKINNSSIIANANGYVSLSQDIKEGLYVQEGTNLCINCDGSTVTNKDGKIGSLMNGMACRSKIIVDKQRVLFYLLEKINLIYLFIR